MRAMPGRLMSLIVIGTRDSRLWVRTSSESGSRCCSKSCANVICAVLIELKQPYLPVLQAIHHPHASVLSLREDQDGLPALEQHARRLVHAERARLGLDAHDLDSIPSPLHVFGRKRADAFRAERSAVLLLVVLDLLLAALQRAFLLLQHGVQGHLGVFVLSLAGQIETVSEYAELRLMAVALLGHGQLRAHQARALALQLLDSPLRLLAVVR